VTISLPELVDWMKTKIAADSFIVEGEVVAVNAVRLYLFDLLFVNMAKDLTSSHQPGSRGKKWFKIKPAETLDVAIVAADWGIAGLAFHVSLH
jgi:ATP-dependent DNA ligase